MKFTSRLVALGGLLALSSAAVAQVEGYGTDTFRNRAQTFEVTITNITKAQVFSPPVLVTHSRDIALFQSGAPALPELAIVAEDGAGQPLVDLVSPLSEVFEAQATSAPLMPGASAVYEITSTRRFPVISVVTMMVNTNDAFVGLNSQALPRWRNSTVSYTALGYDAGSEENNEDCAFIPGPACPGDSGNARATENAEGFVYIHNGVHGIADLGPAAYDWRNPVARISIRRVR